MNPFFKNNDDSQTSHWAKTLHQEGKAAFLSQGLPTPKTEAWKYTKLRELDADDYDFAPLADKGMPTFPLKKTTGYHPMILTHF